MSSIYFNEEHELFRQSLNAFIQREVMPNVDQWEKDKRLPRSIFKKMGDQGYLGLSYPKEYGGQGLDLFYDLIFLEEIGYSLSGGFVASTMCTVYLPGQYILNYGNEEQKREYLPKICSGELVGSLAITEPGAGSDVSNVKTLAKKDGSEYVVNGSKMFITNGVFGDFILAVCKTNPEAGAGGISLILIDAPTDGLSRQPLNKLGWHASDTADISFDNVRTPISKLVGEEGMGFYYLMKSLQIERLVLAIGGYAGCEAAMRETLKYMSEREAFGKTINKFQVLRHRIAQLASEIECVKQFVYYCTKLTVDGIYAVKECSMAKLLATELSDKAMSELLQCFGGYGFIEDFKIARAYRDTRIGSIGGGTSEIMREIIAKMVIDGVKY